MNHGRQLRLREVIPHRIVSIYMLKVDMPNWGHEPIKISGLHPELTAFGSWYSGLAKLKLLRKLKRALLVKLCVRFSPAP